MSPIWGFKCQATVRYIVKTMIMTVFSLMSFLKTICITSASNKRSPYASGMSFQRSNGLHWLNSILVVNAISFLKLTVFWHVCRWRSTVLQVFFMLQVSGIKVITSDQWHCCCASMEGDKSSVWGQEDISSYSSSEINMLSHFTRSTPCKVTYSGWNFFDHCLRINFNCACFYFSF